jgi:HPt (histidine-containing phosphotransfer) domain-containing protein
MSATNLLDRELALDRLGGDEELLDEIMALFRRECPGLLGKLQDAVEHQDARAVMEAAHSMKGSLATLGAEEGAMLALDLEIMGRNSRLDGSTEALLRLERMLRELERELPG